MALKKSSLNTFDLSNSGIIMGSKIETFTLTPLNFYVENKGELAAFKPLYWERGFIDLDMNSKLYIRIAKNLKGNKVLLSLMLSSFYENAPKQTGEIVVDFGSSNYPKNNTGKITVPFHTPINFTEYYIQSSKVFENDSSSIELTFPEFMDVTLAQVKVDIFQPRTLSFRLPRNP